MPPSSPPVWDLEPGQRVKRTTLHRRFGGRGQGGIGPSAKSPNVFVFSDSKVGEQHGYFDDWKSDDRYHYTGEGQRGDQTLDQGNASILNHRQQGRALRVFKGVRGTVTYMGEFVLADDPPWYSADAPETGGGPLRKVIVFRLSPLDARPEQPGSDPLEVSRPVLEVPVEAQNTEHFVFEPKREPVTAERREQALLLRFAGALEASNVRSCRLRIKPAGEAKPLFTDLFVPDLELLIEAKGTVTREAVRMAVGQLADYARFVAGSHRAVLLPERPRPDLLQLLDTQDVGAIWETTPDRFAHTLDRALGVPALD